MSEITLKKILVAEDEADIRVIAQLALEKVGHFEVCFCSSGREILEKVDAFHPDLIILDVMMPEMDGVTTYKALRQKDGYADIPIIFMTAKIQPNEIKEYIGMGAIGVINKPFDPMKLPETIRNIWANRLQ